MNKNITIFFIKGIQANINTASHNRYLMLKKMCEQNFTVHEPVYNKVNLYRYSKSKFINALKYRISILKQAIGVPYSDQRTKNVLFLISTDPVIYFFVSIIARLKGNRLIAERNEYPKAILSGRKWRIFIFRFAILWWQYRLLDGLFLMTDELIHFYSPFTRRKCIVQKLPMTVDFDRFNFVETEKTDAQYIFYAGSFSQKKDGILSLIIAFHSICNRLPGVELWMASSSKNKEEMEKVKKLVLSMGLKEKVKIFSELDRREIPKYMCNSLMLVLPRPESKQAQGGFPTKLGEYLASGKPVIVTKVGEIPKLISDDEVFFISPNDLLNELKAKIQYVFENYKEALDKAKRAKQRAFECFSTEVNSIIVASLINKIR